MKFLFLITLVCASSVSFADVGLEMGYRSTSVEATNTSETSSGSSFLMGVSGDYKVSEIWGFRSAFLYTERSFSLGKGVLENKIVTRTVDIPLNATVYLNGSNSYVYFGPVVSLRLGDTSTTNLYKSNEIQFPLTLGVHLKFDPNFALNLFYETNSNLGSSIPLQSQKSVGISLNVVFD